MADRSAPLPPGRLAYLDGLRFVAVSMVLAYHGGLPGLGTAGFYGVDVFFVLSGFLITSLLLAEQHERGRIRLGAFWGRRAVRLLPALLLMLVAVDLYVAFVAPAGRYPGFRADAFSVLAYVSNWHFVATSSNYFSAAAAPSLLTHTWSLAIEEQFYLVWPLALWAAAAVARRRGFRPAGAVLALSATGAVASAAWMAYLYRAGASPSRLYYGTDTHASGLLVGAALAALVARSGGVERLVGRGVRLATPVALAALAALGWAACDMGSSDPLAYQGGYLAVALVTAGLLAAVLLQPDGPVARVLSFAVFRYIGRISYGMYLWYFPLFAVLDRSTTGLSGWALFALRAGADVAAAAASYHLMEARLLRRRPARTGRDAPAGSPVRARRGVILAGSVAAAAVLVSADTAPAPGASAAIAAPGLVSGSPAEGAGPAQQAAQRPAGRQLRLLVTGDSTGMTLGLDLSSAGVERRYGLLVDDVAMMGCGVAVSASVRSHSVAVVPPPPCNQATPPGGRWPALLRREVAVFRPDVVLLAAGRWEVQSRRPAPAAAWTDITRPADQAYVRAQLELAASIVSSAGARLALATAPCFSSGEQPDGSPWPEDSPARVRDYNNLVRSVAGSVPRATVVDLYSMVCPGGRFHTTIGGVTVRAPDGVHYPFFSVSAPSAADPDTEIQAERFGEWIAPRILAAIGWQPGVTG